MKLYPFQQQILNETKNCNRVGYYLDMGLGKTFVGSEKAMSFELPILVICQKSKIKDWIDHFKEHYDWSVYDLTINKDYDSFVFYSFCGKVGIVNYDLIFRRPAFLELSNFTLILDESSLIQNRSAQRSKFILKMNPTNVILLSGTPTAGKYENLWTQLHLLGWSVSHEAYDVNYVNWRSIDVGGYIHKIVDKEQPYKNVDRLKRKMREHGAMFLKTEEVFDLPAQNFIEVKVKATPEFRQFQKDGIIQIGDVELIGDSILSKRIYSRMLCGHFNADKLLAFRDLCESTEDRLIVFYNFDGELSALKQIAAELERPVSEVNGHVKDLSAYESESNSITLVNYKAGAMGLNLQKANKVIYFTLTDEAELFLQSSKRIHRIGQEKPCFYYLMICQNSIEDREILPTLGIRKKYTDALFEDEL